MRNERNNTTHFTLDLRKSTEPDDVNAAASDSKTGHLTSSDKKPEKAGLKKQNQDSSNHSTKLLDKIVCPNCWSTFAPSEMLWISSSPELIGDFRLGEMEHERFLPTRFDIYGRAVDRKGETCQAVACPFCHLGIPFPVLEMSSYFISIVGAPASGKSYFLAAMTWLLRKTLPQKFCVNIMDADPQMNIRLQEYESAQFLNDDENAVVKIEKTEEQGDLYNTIQMGDQRITYPQPFIFSLAPLPEHRNAAHSRRISTSLCLYDNAGESYLPVRDSDRSTLPVTRHLGKSNCIFFLYDPLQDNRFRTLCRSVSNDPQLRDDVSDAFRKSPLRQEMILAEMIKRTRAYRNMTSTEKYHNPVVIVVTKLDAWGKLLPQCDFKPPWAPIQNSPMMVLRRDKIQKVSDALRQFLLKHTPEIVGTIEHFASDVTYIPISATGISPVIDEQTKESGFRSKDVKPIWAEIPILYALARSTQGVIPMTD